MIRVGRPPTGRSDAAGSGAGAPSHPRCEAPVVDRLWRRCGRDGHCPEEARSGLSSAIPASSPDVSECWAAFRRAHHDLGFDPPAKPVAVSRQQGRRGARRRITGGRCQPRPAGVVCASVRPGRRRVHGYLREAREALLGKLDGLSEYDVRRPPVWTGTKLLGLVKHVALVAAGYFGEVFDRPFPNPSQAWTSTPSRTQTCGPQPTSPATTSSAFGTESGHTRTRQSRRSRSTRPARCGGGNTRR
ncbi:Protein of unknown function [Micromonospora eburnea]|uniref:DUF664 domain-containing protein n=1 Tax=Micromonospora eburnea TaxID=227316 RepID=A0A1C6V1N5_9ACTN|nr:Protein of unknown function [Micromonospora eburnea]